MIDVLSYMLAPFITTEHLGGNANPIYGLNSDSWLWQIKAEAGYPWDGNFYDSEFVYQNITEGPMGWTDPTSYKAFASKTWPNGKGGIVWAPRHIDQNMVVTVTTPDSTYKTYDKGKLLNTANLGVVSTTTYSPVNMTVGLLGVQSVLTVVYQWGPNQEINWYAKGYGWVQWQLWTNGIKEKYSLFDELIAGGTPKLNFPNPLP